MKILLADDQPLVRTGLRMILESRPGFEVVGEAGDGSLATTMTRSLTPDIVLMDVRMPVLDGIEATRRIVATGLPTRVLVLTTYHLDDYVYDALRAGASGFLLKNAPPPELFAALTAVADGDAVLAPAVTRRLLAKATLPHPDPEPDERLAELTPRERDILIATARGLSNAEIAERFGITPGTVKIHVSRVLAKLDLRDRVQLVIFAYESGLIRPDTERSA